MSDVTLDLEYDDYELHTRPVETNLDHVHLSDLDLEESDRIQRTASAAQEAIKLTPQTQFDDHLDEAKLSEVPAAAEKVTNAAQEANIVSLPVDSSASELDQRLAELAAQRVILSDDTISLPADADAELTELLGPNATVTEKKGFLIQINELVADIMKLISKLNDRDRQKTEHMKKDYNKLNEEIGDAISGKGYTIFWANIGALVTRVGGAALGAAFDSEYPKHAGDILGQLLPGLAGGLTTGYEVTQSKATNRLQLITTEMSNISSKSGDNSGWKNELTQSLNDIRQWMTAAARAN